MSPAATTFRASADRACCAAICWSINKIDLAPFVGVDLDAMLAEARTVREGRPILATNARTGAGVDAVADAMSQAVLFR